MSLSYPNVQSQHQSQRREQQQDALVPDPQEYDLYDPDKPLSAADRCAIFDRLTDAEKSN